jgi:WD40 repeat protein
MTSKAAILRVAPLVRSYLSGANARRFDQVVGLVDPESKAELGEVLRALFPRLGRDAALASFRQLRRATTLAAEKANVRLSIETDGQTRLSPADRVVWLEGEDRVTEEVKRLVEAEVRDIERSPQFVTEDRPTRFFVSYAHADSGLKTDLLRRLQTFLSTHPQVRFELWADGNIPLGEKWQTQIRKAMEDCDFGFLLVSPSFLASKFIAKKELPFLLRNRRVIPVAVKPILFDGTMNLKGLGEREIFYDTDGKSYCERTSDNTREAFTRELFQKICQLAVEPSEPVVKSEQLGRKPMPDKGGYDAHVRMAVGDFDEKRFVHTQGLMTPMNKALATSAIDLTQRKDAIEFLTEWVEDKKAPSYCALLGEYGMGKTTTCKALARDLLRRRDEGAHVALPIYLDLRYVGDGARGGLVLADILDLILKRSWKGGPDETALNATELIALVQSEGALVIWDGLDEVLVHLSAHAGQMFTRQLFRIIPRGQKDKSTRGRMLITCRTHYFRTLRDQQNHFLAEDRDSVRAEDYRAPFVLLPFTALQIREYLKHTLPDEDPNRVMEVLSAVHDLREMAERPYTLSLIAGQFAEIERWKAEGQRVTGVMLYRHLVLSWLERDAGKHQLTPDHKQAVMEHLAAALWRAGTRLWSIVDLEQWLMEFLTAHPEVAAHYEGRDRDLLKEDLRTATFLVREAEDRFRFAHSSLHEYFLASYLHRALVEGNPDAWNLPRVSRETLDFLGQWLVEDDGKRRDTALSTLASLRDIYRGRASELAFAYFLAAHGKKYPSPSPAGFQLPGADLTEWAISGSTGAPMVLASVNLRGARLNNSRWRHCRLESAVFDDAEVSQAEFLQCHMDASTWHHAALKTTLFRDCELTRASFEGAHCEGLEFLRCTIRNSVGLPERQYEALYVICEGLQEPDRKKLMGEARVTVSTGHNDRVIGCAWSPNGLHILSLSRDETLRVWDASRGTCLATLTHEDMILACSWSPDGTQIISASADKAIRVWDARGTCLATLTGHQGPVVGCGWSPDGLHIVSASDDKTLRIWDGSRGACLAILTGHESGVSRGLWSPDGSLIVSASEDKTLRVWDARGTCLATLTGHDAPILGCAWSPDGSRIASASGDGTLRIWDARGTCFATLTSGRPGKIFGCAWSPDGQRIASASEDQTLRIWDVNRGRSLASLSRHSNVVCGCAWSPDGRLIASTSPNQGLLRVWDFESGACVTAIQGRYPYRLASSWSPESRRIVVPSLAGGLHICDVRSGTRLAALLGHKDLVLDVAWSPDGKQIASASRDATLGIWDAESGVRLATMSGHQRIVESCAWSPDGRRMVSGSNDKTLRIWDTRLGTCLTILKGHDDSVEFCLWSPDGRWIASASLDETLRIWDANRGNCVATLSGHRGAVFSCAWSPDGKKIVSAANERSLRIWDTTSGSCLTTLTGHESWVRGCSWSPDGSHIASASFDGTLRIWDVARGTETARRIYLFTTPNGGSTWSSVDRDLNRIVACGSEAWRYLRWIVHRSGAQVPDILPAEIFGPLPVVEARSTEVIGD